jgi:hypothetical protein
MGAHRAAWILSNGREIPEGMEIMHTCDNPKCVNPSHLKLATTAENMQDKRIKGRAGKKLTGSQVAQIKRMLAEGRYQSEIANEFEVSQGAISQIQLGITWGWVLPAMPVVPGSQMALPLADL